MKKNINRLLFFIGWILSPLTFWNDAFVNIPIAYLAANLLAGFIQVRFVMLVLICYWASNALGLIIMYMAGKGIMAEGEGIVKEALKLIVTIAIYSAALLVLHYMGILRPLVMR